MEGVERIRSDEARLKRQEQEILVKLKELEAFQCTIKQLQMLQEPMLETQFHVGCGVFMNAVVHDYQTVFINVGLGIHVCCNLEEALITVDAKHSDLKKQLEHVIVQIGKTRASLECASGILSLLEHENTCQQFLSTSV